VLTETILYHSYTWYYKNTTNLSLLRSDVGYILLSAVHYMVMNILKNHTFRPNFIHSIIATLFAFVFLITGITTFASQEGNRVSVLIAFNNQPGPHERALIVRNGGDITHEYTIVPAFAVSIPEKAIQGLSRNKNISAIEPDGVFTLITPTSDDQAALTNELTSTWGVGHIKSDYAHSRSHFGAGVKVAVIDTGIDYTHPEFATVYKGGYNFINRTSNPMDDNNHGTHVAGTIAAAKNGIGVVGVSPHIELYALKVFGADGSANYSDIIAAIDWSVRNGIHIANHSYGSSQDPGTVVRQAYDNAAVAGVLHIAAAGNSGRANGRGDNVNFPARYESVVAVAATDKNNARASFSSTGPAVAIAAPGVGIPSTITNNRYASYNGTSMASPHVAGVAALLKGMNPSLTPTAISEILRNSAIRLGSSDLFGAGLVDVRNATIAAIGNENDSVTQPNEPPLTDNPSTEDILVQIENISFGTTGGRLNDRHLTIGFTLTGNGTPIPNTSFQYELFRDNILFATIDGTTASNGAYSTTINNAPNGTYKIVMRTINAPSGHLWDGTTPPNSFIKR
jgi:subtilisin family serine protease